MRAYDLVHAELGGGALREFYAALMVARTGHPLVVTVHDAPRPVWFPFMFSAFRRSERVARVMLLATGPVGRRLERYVMRSAQTVCATTPSGLVAIKNAFPIVSERLTLIAYPVSDRLLSEPAAFPAPEGALRIAFHGHWMPGKGIERLVSAVSQLRDEGVAVCATLLGDVSHAAGLERSQRYRARVLRQIEDLELQASVAVPGYIDDDHLSPTLAKFDAVVLPYDRLPTSHRRHVASLSAAAHDAILAGVPVVCSGARAIGDLVVDEVNGLIYSDMPGDSLVDSLRRLALEQGLLKRVREGAERSRRDLAHADLGQRMETVYRGVSGSDVQS
jgi:glycosyltransferase involved in cell wall biosynthesis